MRIWSGILAVIITGIPTTLALETRQNDVNVTALLALPKCIQECGLKLLPEFDCTPQQECYCETTGPLSDALAACATSTCPTLANALAAQKFQADTCGIPVRNKTALMEISLHPLCNRHAISSGALPISMAATSRSRIWLRRLRDHKLMVLPDPTNPS